MPGRINSVAVAVVVTVLVLWLAVWLFNSATQPILVQGRVEFLGIVVVDSSSTSTVTLPLAETRVFHVATTTGEGVAKNTSGVEGKAKYCVLSVVLDTDDSYHGVKAGGRALYILSIDECKKLTGELRRGAVIVFYTVPGSPPRAERIVRVMPPHSGP